LIFNNLESSSWKMFIWRN